MNLESFNENKFAYVQNALHEQTAKLAAAYTLMDEKINYHAGNDFQMPVDIHWSANDMLMNSIMFILNPTINKITGLNCIPTYSYYRLYRRGAELKPHVDRPACEISASVCLGFHYPKDYGGWPLYVLGIPIIMNAGDMVVYRGMEVPHWREEFVVPDGYWQSQVFIHYVDANGPYADQKYDGRKGIGI